MPMGKYKRPDKFPQGMHRLLERGVGVWRLGLLEATEEKARLEMRRLEAFRRCVGLTPNHRLYNSVMDFTMRAKVVLCADRPGFDVELTVKPFALPIARAVRVGPQMSDREVFEALGKVFSQKVGKSIDSSS